MMHCTTRILLLLLFCSALQAQLLPVELDETISIPYPFSEGFDLWDIIPHPDGYYVWAQALGLAPVQTKILWGRSDLEGYDSLIVTSGVPLDIALFLRDANEVTIAVFTLRSYGSGDSSFLRLYNLETGIPDSYEWGWRSTYNGGGWPGGSETNDYRLTTLWPMPEPPNASSRVMAQINHTVHSWQDAGAFTDHFYWKRSYILSNLLNGADAALDTFDFSGTTQWVQLNNGVALAALDIWHGVYGGGQYNSYTKHFRLATGIDSVLAIASDTWYDCSLPECYENAITAASNDTGDTAYIAASYNGFGVLTLPGTGNFNWEFPQAYFPVISLDVVPSNGREEFLCYDDITDEFTIFDPSDGRLFGYSSSVPFGIWDKLKLISRYNQANRRIAFRYGNFELRVYRFGEYLAADDNSTLPPSSFSLSNFPNPFNSTTEIRFDLPQTGRVKLTVFDISGREVTRLKDETMGSGSHAIAFDASSLPSGIYIYRIESGGQTLARKMVLLK